MAGDEDEAEQIVADLVVEGRVEIGLRRLLLDFQLIAEFAFLALGKLVAAEAVDRLVLGGGHEPGAGIVGDARSRPLLQRRDQRVLRKLLGRGRYRAPSASGRR